jgi:putative hydrolase of the HAD superfamily
MEHDPAELVELIRRFSFPLEPLDPPPLPPEWNALPECGPVNAVLFDVYGTLFCSAAGDVGTAELDSRKPGRTERLLDELAGEYAPGLRGRDLQDYFEKGVQAIHRELAEKTRFPELRVEELWARFLRDRGTKAAGGEISRLSQTLALRYELAVNPVWPMPGAEETIRRLAGASTVLGLVSNAQFYTPLLFRTFFFKDPAALGFDPALLIYSFEAGEAKPAPGLFRRAADRLAELGLKPEQCCYVGNDMFKDIYGAAAAGFKTALFAGDGRSLRLHPGKDEVRGLKPSRVIRRLAELVPAEGARG